MSGARFPSYILLMLAALAVYLYFSTPSVQQFEEAYESFQIEVRNGPKGLELIDVVGSLKVSIDDVPEHFRQALVLMEDRNFYRHPGVDWKGIGRAIVARVRHGRRQGGSTLTQQLAKNVLLSNDPSLWRKLREATLALKLEWHYDKDEILEMYVNRIYFGQRTYGIEAAARRYFGVRAQALSLYQSALLVGSIPSPSRWNVTADQGRARARARLVLDQMVEAGLIGSEEARRASRQDIRTGGRGLYRIEPRFFIDWLRPRIRQILDGRSGRFTVYTTLDPEMQVYAERSLSQELRAARHKRVGQAAMVVIDRDGAVRAMIGSREYAESPFNRAAQSKRQPGSAFKPLVYLAALEAGWTPAQRILDAPLTIDGWSPSNIDHRYLGSIAMETALARSRNAATVRLLTKIERGRVLELSQRLGIAGPLPDDPSLALGTGEVSLLELVGAYVPFANGGYRAEPCGIIGVRDNRGRILYWHEPSRRSRVLGEGDVGAMNRMLQHVLAPDGTGHRAALAGHAAAGKTGTTQEYRDAWFVGYTAHLVAGVWMGNDDNRSMREVTGGSHPAQAWRRLMSAVHRYMHLEPQPLPGERAVEAAGDALAQASRFAHGRSI